MGLFFVLHFWVSWALADSGCPVRLLSTSFGNRHTHTAIYEEPASIVVLKDGYRPADQTSHARVPVLSAQSAKAPVPFGNARAFASLPDPDGVGAFYAVVGADGLAHLSLPWGKTLPLMVGEDQNIRSVAFHRPPLASLVNERADLEHGIKFKSERVEFSPEKQTQLEKQLGIRLYLATNGAVYETLLQYRRLAGMPRSLTQALLTNALLVLSDEERKPVDHFPLEVEYLDLGALDDGKSYLFASPDPEFGIELSGLSKVYTFEENERPEFLQVPSTQFLVSASTAGNISVVDLWKNRVYVQPRLPGIGWIRSLSAHAVGTEVEIWALNGTDGRLYHWRTDALTPLMKPTLEIPNAGTPQQVATFGSPLHGYYSPEQQGTHGYFANFLIDPRGTSIEQVLVLDADGKIHALRHDLQGFMGRLETDPARKWDSFVFPPSK